MHFALSFPRDQGNLEYLDCEADWPIPFLAKALYSHSVSLYPTVRLGNR